MPRRAAPLLLAALVGAFQLAIGLVAWRTYRIGSWDLTLFDATVRHYSRFQAPVEEALGTHIGGGPRMLALGDHFSPVLALLSPFYWVWADPRMLLVAQALLVAVSTLLAWVLARRALGTAAAYPLALAFGLAWPFQEASVVGFHETLIAVPLLLLAFERLQAGEPGQAAAAALCLLGVKEDLCAVAAGFGVLLVLLRHRRLGLAVIVAGVAGAYVETAVIIPALSDIGVPKTAYYQEFLDALPDPVAALRVAVEPAQKWRTLGWLLAPWGFLPLVSPLTLVGLPQLGVRAISSQPNFWGLQQHYNAVQVPVMYAAAVWVAQRLPRPLRLGWVAWTVVAALWITGRHPGALLWHGDSWRTSPRIAAADQAVAAVPHGVRVEADNEVGPHLAARDTVLLLDTTPRLAPWVLVDVGVPSFPIDSLQMQRDRVGELQAMGYRLVLDNGQYAVLAR
ncbi:DUF2079 domain-containing protein [Motilibacter rhizosphaerae]|uniref:DUF2079 domain-containing protein n=1 Tax=Motilibacter rhizosphaerae TaxID=598652 RepID=UPI0013EE85B9|nr:DUF2079 domain-containing protein [Motilibacter rhizosphaerae]